MDDEDNSSRFLKNWVVVGKAVRSSTKATTSNLRFDQQYKHCEKELINNSLLNLLFAFVSEDDEEMRACKSLFQNKTFFLGHEGFAAVLAVLVTGASQSRQHGKSESDSYYLSD
ncbi:hypothetical protein Tco_0393157 [Tanacetum coccineum]